MARRPGTAVRRSGRWRTARPAGYAARRRSPRRTGERDPASGRRRRRCRARPRRTGPGRGAAVRGRRRPTGRPPGPPGSRPAPAPARRRSRPWRRAGWPRRRGRAGPRRSLPDPPPDRYDGNRAGGPVQHTVGGGPEGPADAGTDHEQLREHRGGDQGPGRSVPHDDLTDDDVGFLLGPAGQRLGQYPLLVGADLGPVHERTEHAQRRLQCGVLPGVHGDQVGAAAGGLGEGVGEDLAVVLAALHPHDDRAAVAYQQVGLVGQDDHRADGAGEDPADCRSGQHAPDAPPPRLPSMISCAPSDISSRTSTGWPSTTQVRRSTSPATRASASLAAWAITRPPSRSRAATSACGGSAVTPSYGHDTAVTRYSGAERARASSRANLAAASAALEPSTPTTTGRAELPCVTGVLVPT